MRFDRLKWLCAAVLTLSIHSISSGQALLIAPNMEVLKCKMPDATYRLAGSNAPGQMFTPGEPVNLKLVFTKGKDSGAVDFALEIQEITTRDPNAKAKGAFTDTAGEAPLIGLNGDPIKHAFKVTFDDKPEAALELANVPLPEKFGTYAIVLVRGGDRQFLASAVRIPKIRDNGNTYNVPIFGEGQFMTGDLEMRNAIYSRMGVRGYRSELSWSETPDGVYHWENYDKLFEAAEKNHMQIMVTLGGHPPQWRPFGEPTPASGWTKDTGGYSGTGDWLCAPENYERYGKWITAFVDRYWKGGKGALWGLENYNEPWEGGGISGWARDLVQYRAIQKLIAESARKAAPEIELLAASSIMNTEDKLYSDGTNEFDKYVTIFTDHYVVPDMCYGPMVARAHGKQSMETETWFVNSEYLLPQGVAQFMASGQDRISPWHPRVLFDSLPGGDDNALIPSPVVAANAAMNYLITGKKFEKVVFHNHLPWVFQYGKDDDNSALLILFGQLMPISGSDPKERLWPQVDGADGGTITIDNADGLLQFYDLAGNPEYVDQKSVTLPLTIAPTYITSTKGPVAAAERIKAAKIDGKRAVEIIPHDFTSTIDKAGAKLVVTIHNCLNRPVSGNLTIKGPGEIKFKADAAKVELAAGERKDLIFDIDSAKAIPANAYPFDYTFASDAGEAKYSEVENVCIAAKGKKTIDGNLDDWNDVPGVTVVAGVQKAESTENIRRPWLEMKDQVPNGNYAEFKVAWDENFLYVAARVNDPTAERPNMAPMAGRDENKYFHTKADDDIEPYKTFINLPANKGKSFADVPYVYRNSPEGPQDQTLPVIPFRRDRLQIALDVTDDWHDLTPTTDKVPYGLHAVPDTDYEYSLYAYGAGESELWRQLAPGVPRIHDWPRQLRGEKTTGPVSGAQHVVKRDGNTYIYEMAIPKAELATLNLTPGTTFGLMLRAGNSSGPHVDFGNDKAVTKVNGLSLHPYWERSSNCGVRWTLAGE